MTDTGRLEDALFASVTTGRLIPAPVDNIRLNDAYAIQHRVFERRGAELAGWKLGLTSAAAQKRLGLSRPVAGRLASSDILKNGEDVESKLGTLYAEAELAVTLHSDLPPRAKPYGSSEIASVIGAVYAGIELCTSRYVDDEVEAPALIADNAFAYRLVLGRTLASGWNSRFASMAVTLDCGPAKSVHGSTSAVMGNPLEAVVWLVNWLSNRGERLRRGHVIATGSCTGITEVHSGETVRATFAGAEGASVTIIQGRDVRRQG